MRQSQLLARTSILLAALLLLTNCAKVDSTKVFDQEQAAYLLSQTNTAHPTQQMIKLNLPQKATWQRIDMSYGTVGSPIMLIPKDETRDDWTQSIRTKIKPFALDANITAGKWVQNAIDHANIKCKHVSTDHFAINGNEALYQLRMSQCKDDDLPQVQIGKAFTGSDAVYVVYYTAITTEISEKQISLLAQVIDKAQLVRRM